MLFAPRDANIYDRWLFNNIKFWGEREEEWRIKMGDPRIYEAWLRLKKLERKYHV